MPRVNHAVATKKRKKKVLKQSRALLAQEIVSIRRG